MSTTNFFAHPNYLINIISHMNYPTVRKLCISNRQINFICRNDPVISKLIAKKKAMVEEKPDEFLQSMQNVSKQHIIRAAVQEENVEVVDELIRRGYDPSAELNYVIVEASGRGDLTIVNRLLEDPRVDPGAWNDLAIKIASNEGHLDVVDRLLQDERVDPRAMRVYD